MISFQDRWFSDAPFYPSDCQDKYMEAMQYTWGGPLLIGDTARWFPLWFGTNVYTQTDREQSWTNLLAWFGDPYTRNFYYHGHGGATSIGCDAHTFATNGSVTGGTFTSSRSRSRICSWQVAQTTRNIRYRFVFLDGCSTAAGDWPNAFSVSKTNHDISFYQNDPKHRRPSVFVGWNQTVGGEPGTDIYHWLNWEANWMGIWANDPFHPGIKDSLVQANTIFNWLPVGTFNSKLRVYGYGVMKIGEYNGKGDWRWP